MSDILQTSNTSSGVQLDTSFSNFVLDNGPGSVVVDLRGLGAARALNLINGHRVAPAGIGGAPSSADLSLIPSLAINRIDLLLDAASSVYGSDAVAGVVNIILRKDLEGLEIQGGIDQPFIDAGHSKSFGLIWGINNDQNNIVFSGEYQEYNAVQAEDIRYYRGCPTYYQEDQNGNILTEQSESFPGLTNLQCQYDLHNRIYIPVSRGYGSVYYTEGKTNIGIPNFSENYFRGKFLDTDGDGKIDVNIKDSYYNASAPGGFNGKADFFPHNKLYSFMSYGEHNFNKYDDLSAFFEAMYSNRLTESVAAPSILFPEVPANNPFNPCNMETNGGTGCLENLGLRASLPVSAIIRLLGDRNETKSRISLIRVLGGLKGNLNILNKVYSGFQNWTHNSNLTYSRSSGYSRTKGVSKERLNLSLYTTIQDPDLPGQYICGHDYDGDGRPDSGGVLGAFGDNHIPVCVPINLFAPDVFNKHKLSPKEEAWLFVPRTVTTVYEMVLFSSIFQGELFKLPWNNLSTNAAFGVEYRFENIDSQPDRVTREAELWGYFKDLGAEGSKDLYEAFFEIDTPLISDKPFIYNLHLNASARYTREQYYGSALTYSGKLKYQITDYLTLRGTYGTSFRAPSLREQFLKGISGFSGGRSDPCIVPNRALDNDGNYLPSRDTRTSIVLENCRKAGVDPTSLGVNGAPGIESFQKGSTDIKEETSKSKTVGIVFEQPWTDAFDLKLSATYYDIDLRNTIINPSVGYIFFQCYYRSETDYCSKVNRDPNTGFTKTIDRNFINIGYNKIKGIDYNLRFRKDFSIRGNSYTFTTDLRATNQFQNNIKTVSSLFKYAGDINFPRWRGRALFSVEKDNKLSLYWRIDIQGRSQNEPEEYKNSGTTCSEEKNITCRDITKLPDYFLHTFSVNWKPSSWSFTAGIRNVFDDRPPFVADSAAWNVSILNVPTGSGYNLLGRSLFLNVRKSF